MSPAITNVVLFFHLSLVLAGLVLLWKVGLSPAARRKFDAEPRIPDWDSDPAEFLLLIALVFVGMVGAALAASRILKLSGLTGDQATVLAGAASQLGMLAGVVLFAFRSGGYRSQAACSAAYVLKSGFATFLITLPVLHATGKAWEILLRLFGLQAERQDLIRMFLEADSSRFIVVLVVLAVIVAPVAEELVFRAGLFRLVRKLAPRWLALVAPGLLFASLHVNWGTLEGFGSFVPLLVLAVIFSIAYERTGNIGTTIIAHALFNLNTVVLIFCGFATE